MIAVPHDLVGVQIYQNYYDTSIRSGQMARKHLGFSSLYGCYDNLIKIPVHTSFSDTYTISVTSYYDSCGLYNIHAYVVMFIDYGFCIITFVSSLWLGAMHLVVLGLC